MGDDFEVDGRAGFRTGLELPLGEGGLGVGVELRVEAASDLNAVDGTVGVNDSVQNDFTLDILVDEIGRVLGIDFPDRYRHGEFRRSGRHRRRPAAEFGEMQNPASARAIDIGHVDGESVNALGGENLFRLCAGRKRREVRRTGAFLRVFGLAVGIRASDQAVRGRQGEF